jgi:putative ABC transport system permease protein
MRDVFQDFRLALRTILARPGFVTVVIITLALGIGLTAAVFSVVSGVLLRPLPFPQPDRLVRLYETAPSVRFGSISAPNLDDWRAQSHSFEQLAGMSYASFNLAGTGEPERLSGFRITPELLPLLRVAPTLGRGFVAEEHTPGRDREILISHDLWQRRFGGSPEIVGRAVSVNGAPHTIVGVMPAGFFFAARVDVWTPFVRDAADPAQARGNHFLAGYGRLAAGVTPAQAAAELDTIAARLGQTYPGEQGNRGIVLYPLHEILVAQIRPQLLLVLGAVGLVLLIACANVASLLLARSAARSGEIAVRAALGASRWRLVRQLLVESLVLAILGGGFGLLLAVWGTDFAASRVRGLAPSFHVAVDGGVLAFTAAVSVACAFGFGLWPALRASRADLGGALKEGARAVSGPAARGRRILLVGQVALSLTSLVGAGLLVRSFVAVLGTDRGFDARGVVTLQVAMPAARSGPEERTIAFYRAVLERARSLPGVEAAGVVSFLPLARFNSNGDFEIEGHPFPPGEAPVTEHMAASADYFRTLGMRVVAGRGLAESDNQTAPRVAVVNQTFARRIFGEADPIGQHMRWGPDEPWMTIVGVVADVKRWAIDRPAVPETYFPYVQQPFAQMALAVRTRLDPGSMLATLRREVAAVDPAQAVFDARTLEDIVEDSLAQRRFVLVLLALFAGAAVLLAAVGLYGLLTHQVVQRTREIGIRMALGARAGDVSRLVVLDGLGLAALGVALGTALALGASRLLGSLLYGVTAADPVTYAAVALLLLVVAALASFIPARRATRVDPMVAFRG